MTNTSTKNLDGRSHVFNIGPSFSVRETESKQTSKQKSTIRISGNLTPQLLQDSKHVVRVFPKEDRLAAPKGPVPLETHFSSALLGLSVVLRTLSRRLT